MLTILIAIVVGVLAYKAGWESAHRTVAHECDMVGFFYVGDVVYTAQRYRVGALSTAEIQAAQDALGEKNDS